MNNVKLAYLAGIVDGEGCLQLSNPFRDKVGTNQIAYFNIVNSSLKILAECQSTLTEIIDKPIKLYPKKKQGGTLDMFYIMIPNKWDCYRILKSIYPYLHEKQDKCGAILKILELRGFDTKNKRYSEVLVQTWKDEWAKLWSPRTTKRQISEISEKAIV